MLVAGAWPPRLRQTPMDHYESIMENIEPTGALSPYLLRFRVRIIIAIIIV